MDRRGTAAVVLGVTVVICCTALFIVGQAKNEQVIADRAVALAEEAAKEEVQEQVGGEIASEVQDQLDERLVPTVDLPPLAPDGTPFDLKPTTTTTEASGPFNLTTTTTSPPPEEPPPTTTTIIEVPTTVTIPDLPLP